MLLWSGMIADTRPARASRPRRMIKVMMLLLGIVAAPSVGLQAVQRPHCVQHGAMVAHGGHGSTAEHATSAGTPAWSRAHSHECAHCPASECARVTPCTSSTPTALSPVGLAVIGLLGHRVPLDAIREQAASAYSLLDTPPPQLIA
jgi:hypothetical protein